MRTTTGLCLGDRYTLQDRLAVGGMGEVWSAHDDKLNRPVAVKVLRTDLAPEPSFQARFRAEARTAAMLSHGGIAAVFDYGEANGAAYLVMELVPGEPLSAMIARQGALGTDTTLQIVGQAARALHAAHRHGVVHRDIKPANLMVTPELRVKVTDFGIARPRDHEPLTATGQVMGTAHYLAPELARGEVASPLSDVYALGVVAYECLAGWRPFEGDNQVAVATAHLQDEPPPLPGTVPAPVRAVVEQAMSKDKTRRPQGANEFARLLEDLRLRGLAGDYGRRERTRTAGTAPSWPVDAATPPRGAPRPAHPSGSVAPAGPAGPPTAAEHLPHYSPAARPADRPPGRPAGQPPSLPPGYPATGFGDGRHEAPFPPSGRRSHPPTLQVPAKGRPLRAATTSRGRSALTVPLTALLVLVLLVVIGGAWRSRADVIGGVAPAPIGHTSSTRVAPVGTDVQRSHPQAQGGMPRGAGAPVGHDTRDG